MGRRLLKAVTVQWMADLIGCDWSGDNIAIDRVDAADQAGPTSLCFVNSAAWCERSKAAGVRLGRSRDLAGQQGSLIYSDVPRLDYARLASLLGSQIGFHWSQAAPDVHPSARVAPSAVLGAGVRIGPDTVIGHHSVIGNEVVVGARCIIKSGAIVGEEGFGFERKADGSAVRLPHLGTVVIHDDVEIGSFTTVCRGTIANTEIHRGAKIDDHVHVAHNVIVDEDAFVIACAELSGGARIGKRAWIAPGASLLPSVRIGDDAVVGLGAVVLRSVDCHATVVGNPARPLASRTK